MDSIGRFRTSRHALLATALLSLVAGSGIVNATEKAVSGNLISAGVSGGPRAPELNRYELASQLLDRWQPIAGAVGERSDTWREMFSAQFALMDVSSLRDLAAVNADVGDAKASYATFVQTFRNAIMQAHISGQAAKGQAKLGSLISDQVFIPIVPCRVVDTRNVGGAIPAGTARNFFFYSNSGSFSWATQGGAPYPATTGAGTTCPGTVSPNGGTPTAAMVSVSVVSPTAAGNWIVWGGASPPPGVAALLWSAGQNLTATTVVPWGGGPAPDPGVGSWISPSHTTDLREVRISSPTSSAISSRTRRPRSTVHRSIAATSLSRPTPAPPLTPPAQPGIR